MMGCGSSGELLCVVSRHDVLLGALSLTMCAVRGLMNAYVCRTAGVCALLAEQCESVTHAVLWCVAVVYTRRYKPGEPTDRIPALRCCCCSCICSGSSWVVLFWGLFGDEEGVMRYC